MASDETPAIGHNRVIPDAPAGSQQELDRLARAVGDENQETAQEIKQIAETFLIWEREAITAPRIKSSNDLLLDISGLARELHGVLSELDWNTHMLLMQSGFDIFQMSCGRAAEVARSLVPHPHVPSAEAGDHPLKILANAARKATRKHTQDGGGRRNINTEMWGNPARNLVLECAYFFDRHGQDVSGTEGGPFCDFVYGVWHYAMGPDTEIDPSGRLLRHVKKVAKGMKALSAAHDRLRGLEQEERALAKIGGKISPDRRARLYDQQGAVRKYINDLATALRNEDEWPVPPGT